MTTCPGTGLAADADVSLTRGSAIMYAGSTAARTIDFGARWKRAIAATAALRDFGPPYDGFGSKSGLKADVRVESDLAPIADVGRAPRHVAEVP